MENTVRATAGVTVRRRRKRRKEDAINVKDNSWGIGYDPYAGAEEFRKRDQHELMKKRERYSKEK